MHWVDWLITFAVFAGIAAISFAGRYFMKDVAGYLTAGRSAGRYLLTVSASASMVGAISIVALFERNMEAGFVLQWWEPLAILVMVVAMLTGWVIYRFRETRCQTLAEFFERRYSRRFRIFSGLVTFLSGMLNFGIFPSVGSRFFLYFCGLPETVTIFNVTISMYITIMILLLAVSLWVVLLGGQVCVMLTDFVQGAFTNVAFVVITVYLLMAVSWSSVAEVLTATTAGHSKVNPFDTGNVQDFNFGFFLIGMIGWVYARMSWQGEQAYNASAKSAHEAKMGAVLYVWNDIGKLLFTTIVPVLAFVVLSHSDWGHVQATVAETMTAIDNPAIQSQMRVPVTLRELLPIGLRGMMAAMMLGAFISTHTTYLHSWSSIFVQDVVLPLRRRGARISQQAQLTLLRCATVGVALFALIFSSFFVPTEAVQLYFAATGAIFAGWSGAVIIGGLYWSRGTTRGAWVAAISGVIIVLIGLLLQQDKAGWEERGVALFGLFDWLGIDRAGNIAEWVHTKLPNGQQLWGWSMLICALLYIAAAYPWKRQHDLNQLLNRDTESPNKKLSDGTKGLRSWRRFIGINEQFTKWDRALYGLTLLYNGGWVLVLLVGTFVAGWFVASGRGSVRQLDASWVQFWQIKTWIMVGVTAIVSVWLLIGGIRDATRMLRDLRTRGVNVDDTGIVEESGDAKNNEA